MVEKKGFEYLVGALVELKKREVDFRARIVGGGPLQADLEKMVRDGKAKDHAHIARLTELTRARVSQIVGLALLPAQIQEEIVEPRAGHCAAKRTEGGMRPILSTSIWAEAMRMCHA